MFKYYLTVYTEATKKAVSVDELAIQKKIAKLLIDSGEFYGSNKSEPYKINMGTADPKEAAAKMNSILPRDLQIHFKRVIPLDSPQRLSGSLVTYEFELKDGSTFRMANSAVKGAGKIIAGKETLINKLGKADLKPNYLGMDGIEFKSATIMVNKLNKAIQTTKQGDVVKRALYALTDSIQHAKVLTVSSYKSNVNIQEGQSDDIIMTNECIDALKNISQNDIDVIANNFGEVLGAIYVFNKYDGVEFITFPSQGNNPLVDFVINNKVLISSKAGTGSATSITKIAQDFLSKSGTYKTVDKRIVQLFNAIVNMGTVEGFIECMKIMDTQIYHKLNSMNIANRTAMNAYITNVIQKRGTGALLNFLKKEIWIYAKDAPKKTEKDIDSMMKRGVEPIGLILYPGISELVTILNEPSNGLTKDLSFIAKDMGVKQLSMKMVMKHNKINFTFKDFKNHEFRFETSGSVEHINKKLSFKLV